MAAEVENLGLKMSILLSNLNGVLVHRTKYHDPRVSTITVRSGVRTLPDPKCKSKCPLVRYYRCAIVHILILICYQMNTLSVLLKTIPILLIYKPSYVGNRSLSYFKVQQ